jgi:hypothetical protein
VPFFFGQILTLLPLHIFYTIHPVEEPDNFMCTRHFQTKSECQPNRWQARVIWQEIAGWLDWLNENYGTDPTLPGTNPALTGQVKSLENQIEAVKRELKEGLNQRWQRATDAYEGGVIELEEYRQRRAGLQEKRKELEKQLTTLGTELEQAKDSAGATERITTALEVWQRLKTQATGEQRHWSKELVLQLKHEVLQPLLAGIYISEQPTGPERGKWGRKEKPKLKFKLK